MTTARTERGLTTDPADPTSTLPMAVQVLLPAGSTVLWPGRLRGGGQLTDVGRGRCVVLIDWRLGSRRRLRRRAGRLGLLVQAEYLVLPSWGAAAFAAEDDPDTVAWLMATIATVPPSLTRGARLLDALLRMMQAPGGRGALRRLAPGRILIGVTP